jgi:hypothetical protein
VCKGSCAHIGTNRNGCNGGADQDGFFVFFDKVGYFLCTVRDSVPNCFGAFFYSSGCSAKDVSAVGYVCSKLSGVGEGKCAR